MNKRVHAFLKDISPKVNVIAQLDFELAYFDVAVKYINHYATRTPSSRNGCLGYIIKLHQMVSSSVME